MSCIRHIVIVRSDFFHAHVLHTAARERFPHAQIVALGEVAEAEQFLAVETTDLLIIGGHPEDGDALDFLAFRVGPRAGIVFVVTDRKEARLLVGFNSLSIAGMFDPATEGVQNLATAMASVATGGKYWSYSIIARLKECLQPTSICQRLTPTEQLIFSLIGDGSDDQAAADRLGMKRSSVHAVRRELHRKLGLQHKGELQCAALQHGFVQITHRGTCRPGLAMLMSACRCGRGKACYSEVEYKKAHLGGGLLAALFLSMAECVLNYPNFGVMVELFI